jgi:hypothetical protein
VPGAELDEGPPPVAGREGALGGGACLGRPAKEEKVRGVLDEARDRRLGRRHGLGGFGEGGLEERAGLRTPAAFEVEPAESNVEPRAERAPGR